MYKKGEKKEKERSTKFILLETSGPVGGWEGTGEGAEYFAGTGDGAAEYLGIVG